MLQDTPTNRKRLEKALAKIVADIASGTFDYVATFPGSRNIPGQAAESASAPARRAPAMPMSASAASAAAAASPTPSPSFKDFTATWLAEHQIEWRRQLSKIKASIDARAEATKTP